MCPHAEGFAAARDVPRLAISLSFPVIAKLCESLVCHLLGPASPIYAVCIFRSKA